MASPHAYSLPDGNVLISFSGGRTSGYMLHELLRSNGCLPDHCKVVFCNTGMEDSGTLDFVQECSQRWNVPIVWLEYDRIDNKVTFQEVSHNSASRHGEPFKTLIDSKHGYLPNQQVRYCTQEMKVLTIKRYLVSLGWSQWSNTVGIRADEARRVKESGEKRWQNWYPLVAAQATQRTVMDFWKSQIFDLEIMPGAGNCSGCFLKSEATLAAMCREKPDHMQWWADMEQASGQQFHKNRTYKELGDFVDRQGDWIFSDQGFLCQADGGECTS